MVIVRVDIRELNKLDHFMRNVPDNVTREVDGTNLRFMKHFKMLAKAMAPRDTGKLKNSIKLAPAQKSKNTKIYKIVANARYAGFQEHGFKPHYAPIGKSNKMSPGVYFVKKYTPFIEPALQRSLKSFDSKLNSAVNRALK